MGTNTDGSDEDEELNDNTDDDGSDEDSEYDCDDIINPPATVHHLTNSCYIASILFLLGSMGNYAIEVFCKETNQWCKNFHQLLIKYHASNGEIPIHDNEWTAMVNKIRQVTFNKADDESPSDQRDISEAFLRLRSKPPWESPFNTLFKCVTTNKTIKKTCQNCHNKIPDDPRTVENAAGLDLYYMVNEINVSSMLESFFKTSTTHVSCNECDSDPNVNNLLIKNATGYVRQRRLASTNKFILFSVSIYNA